MLTETLKISYLKIHKRAWQYSASLSSILCLMILLFLMASCDKWDLEEQSFEEIVTGDFRAGTLPTEANVAGTITGLVADDFVDLHGHVWSLASVPSPSIENKLGQSQLGKNGNGDYLSTISELTSWKNL